MPSSPWLMDFEENNVPRRIRSPSNSPYMAFVTHGLIQTRDLSPQPGVPPFPEILFTPTSHLLLPPTFPQGTHEGTVTQGRFFALAARAYQEAVKFPEEPPQFAWTPDDACHSYYDAILHRFGNKFRENLMQQGRFHKHTFEAEWAAHARNIMGNIRAEWGIHPMGSTASIRTMLQTQNSPAAVLALQYVVQKPRSPPPAGWAVGDPLHPYYELLLDRFYGHLRYLLLELGPSLFQHPIDIPLSIDSFAELIIRENRENWIEMFGL